MRLLKMIAALSTLSMIISCAAISRGPDQQVHVNAYDEKSNDLLSADCFLNNDEGIVYTRSNKSVTVGRDKDPLTVDCYTDEMSGQSIVDGKINAGFLAVNFFVIDYCIISCWVDGVSGSWAEYPSLIDISLDSKDEDHYKRIDEMASDLKLQIEEYKKAATYIDQSDNYSVDRMNRKIKETQNALNKISTELSLRGAN